MYHGQSSEYLYLFFACINKKKLNFAGIYRMISEKNI